MQNNTSIKSTEPSLLLDGEPQPVFALACLRAVQWTINKSKLVKRINSADQRPGVTRLDCPQADEEGNCNAISTELQV
jgi:hypothetical protein